MQDFTAPIRPKDRNRFLRVARCIQSFQVSSESMLQNSAIRQIERSCTLPALRILNIVQTSESHSLVFFKPGVVDLSLECSISTLILPTMTRVEQMHNLARLRLTGCLQERRIAMGFAPILKGFSELEIFTFDAASSTLPGIFEALSHLPVIRHIRCEELEDTRRHSEPLIASQRTFAPDEFMALKSLEFMALPANHSRFHYLLHAHNFSTLRELDVRLSPSKPGNNDGEHARHHHTFEVIANGCPSLSNLAVFFINPRNIARNAVQISFATIEPIVSRLHLSSFSLKHPLTLNLIQADIVEIAKAWGPTITRSVLSRSIAYIFKNLASALTPELWHRTSFRHSPLTSGESISGRPLSMTTVSTTLSLIAWACRTVHAYPKFGVTLLSQRGSSSLALGR